MGSARKSFALCIDNNGYRASLILGKVYRLLPDPTAAKDDLVRIVDESGEDYLYHKDHFVFVDFPSGVKKKILALQRAAQHGSERLSDMSVKTTGTVKYTLDPKRPPALTKKARARLDRLADKDIDLSDIPATHGVAWNGTAYHEARDIEIINRNAERLNSEATHVLEYQRITWAAATSISLAGRGDGPDAPRSIRSREPPRPNSCLPGLIR